MSTRIRTWGDFQSLFQLAVGLNTAFAALYDFLGNTPKQKAGEARAWLVRARSLETDWASLAESATSSQNPLSMPEEIHSIIAKFVLVEGDFLRIIADNETLVSKYIRWIFLAFSVSNLVLLIISSFYFNGRIVITPQIIAVVSFVPFAVGLGAVLYYLMQIHLKSLAMSDYQADLLKAENYYLRITRERGDQSQFRSEPIHQ